MKYLRYLVLGALLLIAGCGGGQAFDGKAGDTAKLSGAYDQVLVYGAPGDVQNRDISAKSDGIGDLIKKGAINPVDTGTKVKVLEFGGSADVRKVEVLEGKLKGKQGYVPLVVMKKDK